MSKVLTVCPFCGCGCGVILHVENNQVLSASPQRAHPVSRGTLCVKGWNGHQIIHHSARLKKPLIKRNGEFTPVDWDTALQLVADKLGSIKKQYGADSIGVVGSIKCTNEEHYLLNRFARAVIGTNNIDTSARFYHAATALAFSDVMGAAASSSSILQLEKTEAILIVGANAKSQLARIGSYVLQAAKKGVRTILVDPRVQEHARFFTLQVRPKPGSDFTFINALVHIIIKRDWYDPDAENIDIIAKQVDQFTPDYCQRITGVPGEELEKTAELFATAKSGMVLYGTGLTQQAGSSAALKALWNLACITGNIGKEGCGILALMFSNNIQGGLDMGLSPELLPGHHSVSDADAVARWEDVWNCKVRPNAPGLTLQDMIRQAGDGIKAMYIVGENLAWSAPDALAAQKALNNLDFLVVQDLFLTETAQLADVVLPAASYAEKEGTFTNTERRIQKVNQAIPPLGDSKQDWEIVAGIAQKMGVPFNYKTPEEIFSEITANISFYRGLSYQALKKTGGVQWPTNGNGGTAFLIPSLLGKEKFSPVEIQPPKTTAEQPDNDYPFTLIVGRVPFHRITGTQNTRSFTLAKEFPTGTVEVNTDDARRLKIRSGWQVKVKTRRGEVMRTVVVTRDVPAGTLFMPIHHKDGLTQSLVCADLDPETKTPLMKTCAAKLEVEL